MRADDQFDLAMPILVTGASGFIGVKVVETLLDYGFRDIRCFVRPSSRTERLRSVVNRFQGKTDLKIVTGDLLFREDAHKATQGVSVVYHLAAGIEKSFAGAFMNSALTTRNLLDAFLENGNPKRFVNISSFAVYSNFCLPRKALLDEQCPMETNSQARFDPYGFGKLKQDELVVEYGKSKQLPYVIVRPGSVFGPGKTAITGRVGIDTFGFFIHVGGSNILPLTYVDNCAEAIVRAGLIAGVEGQVFNIVDDDLPTSSQFLRAYKKRVKKHFSLRLPYFIAYGLSALWEKYSEFSLGQLPPVFNRRRCAAEWKGNRFSNQKLRSQLGWKPKVAMGEAMVLFLNQFDEKR